MAMEKKLVAAKTEKINGHAHNLLNLKDNKDQENDVSFVRIIWTDITGQYRCRVVPINRFNGVVKKNGIGLPVASVALKSCVDGIVPGTDLTEVGEMRLVPDLSTKRTIPWMKREAMVLGDLHIGASEAFDYCPREALRRVSKILKDEFNLAINAGFEIEFVLLKNASREGGEEWVPIDSAPYCSTSGYDAAAPILHEFVDALHSLNIPVEQFHAEIGRGQFELVLEYTTCMLSADNLIYARETIKSIARKHGILATFVPKYEAEELGSGCHVHISLSQNGKNVFMASDGSSKHGMSTIGAEFMAGVLNHLPSILAITAPLPNSYDRIQPNALCGAFQCWGKENREAALRTASPPGSDGLVTNFEFRTFDGFANPYLGLAAIIAAGIDGLRNHFSLPEPIDANPFLLDEGKLRLPKSLSESVEALEKDKVLEDLLGESLVAVIKGVRKAEIDHFSKHKDAYKQLKHRY